MKYVKVMFDNKSHANGFEYKIDEMNIASHWDPKANNPSDMGGFNFSTEDKILRWLIRGNTLYDVIIPENAEVVKVDNKSTPNGVFRTNKIIITNPKKVTDTLAYDLYLKTNIPEKSYYKTLAGLMVLGYKKTALKLIEDHINQDNIETALNEINEFIEPFKDVDNGNNTFNQIMDKLKSIKNCHIK